MRADHPIRSRGVYATVTVMTQPPEWRPGRAAGGTVVVLLVLFGVFCVLPAMVCGLLALLGSVG